MRHLLFEEMLMILDFIQNLVLILGLDHQNLYNMVRSVLAMNMVHFHW